MDSSPRRPNLRREVRGTNEPLRLLLTAKGKATVPRPWRVNLQFLLRRASLVPHQLPA
ncbi:protein of unknown function [Candidatus Nitrospira inopinata]|uniref:Uncharacterized protein n=1 Tax=Candidatus Nitrospira inopinata TaxID=1715989 RepID=A0A0S4KSE6_9BACT|nr:protein of unknown function [Candidatus Nitrospira inopinata]